MTICIYVSQLGLDAVVLPIHFWSVVWSVSSIDYTLAWCAEWVCGLWVLIAWVVSQCSFACSFVLESMSYKRQFRLNLNYSELLSSLSGLISLVLMFKCNFIWLSGVYQHLLLRKASSFRKNIKVGMVVDILFQVFLSYDAFGLLVIKDGICCFTWFGR